MSIPSATHLNYHHLRIFWTVATTGTVSAAAREMRLAQSTLSAQLARMEDLLGHRLFTRLGRRMELTEAGRIALRYATTIFESGHELVQALRHPGMAGRAELRVGAVSPLSKNLQMAFIEPALRRQDCRLHVRQGSLGDLLDLLREHALDVVLSTVPARTDEDIDLHNHLIAEMPAVVVGRPPTPKGARNPARILHGQPVFLPTRASALRAAFDRWAETNGVQVELRAEVDDMALLRLLALSGRGYAVAPEIVVAPELRRKQLVRVCQLKGIRETFYAITARRRIPNPIVADLMRSL